MQYTIWFRSVPGMYEQYVTKATVYADDGEEAIEKAYQKIKRDWPDRSRDMWKVDNIVIGEK